MADAPYVQRFVRFQKASLEKATRPRRTSSPQPLAGGGRRYLSQRPGSFHSGEVLPPPADTLAAARRDPLRLSARSLYSDAPQAMQWRQLGWVGEPQ